MRIGEKVVVRVDDDKSILSMMNGMTGTIIDEKISNSQLAMLSGASRWIVEFDKPANIHGSTLTTCEFKENELECVEKGD